MSELGRDRYDRSRYGAGSDKRSSSARERNAYERDYGRDNAGDSSRGRDFGGARDNFYDDMRISAADPDAMRTVGDYSRGGVDAREEGLPDVSAYSRESYAKRRVNVGRASDTRGGGDGGNGNGNGSADAASRRSARAKVTQRKASKRRIGLIVAIVAAVVVLVGAGAAYAYFNNIANNLHEGVDDDLRAVLVQTDMANEPFYMLLLGTDGSYQRDMYEDYGGQYRSDSMMLARIDPVEKKATLVSISRDILVDLGGEYGEQKINNAYALGGPALAVKAVSQIADVPINHYAQVDFDGFSAMVDALGGIEVEVPMSFDDADAGGALEAGVQTLNGEQALVLCRMRNAYSDVAAHPDEMRAANQRLVLSAIAKKLLASDIATIASTVQAMSSYVTTDLELTDIIGIAQVMKGLDPETSIYTASLPTTSQYIDGGWYEFINKDEWAEMQKRIKNGEPPVEEAVVDAATGTVLATSGAGASVSSDKTATITVKNATETVGLATQLRSKLMESGYTNVVVGDITDSSSYPQTVVVYDLPGYATQADEIVKIVGQGKAVENDGSYLLMDTDFMIVIGDDWKQ